VGDNSGGGGEMKNISGNLAKVKYQRKVGNMKDIL